MGDKIDCRYWLFLLAPLSIKLPKTELILDCYMLITSFSISSFLFRVETCPLLLVVVPFELSCFERLMDSRFLLMLSFYGFRCIWKVRMMFPRSDRSLYLFCCAGFSFSVDEEVIVPP